MPLAIGLGISAAAGLGGSAIQGASAKNAGKAQAQAAEQAAQLQYQASQNADNLIQNIYNQNVQRLQPFVGAGTGALESLQTLTGTNGQGTGNPLTSPLTKPFQPTMEQLGQTPGYQFALQQGLLATGAQSSSQGMGSAVSGAGQGNTTPGQGGIGASGPLGKALANYAEGLASTTYQNQFNNYLAQNMQTYNMLSGQVGIGENAAAQTGSMGTTAGGQSANALLTGAQAQGSYLTAGAAATAAGTVGAGNAAANALTGLGNNALLYGLIGGQGAGGLFGTGAAATS